MSALARIRTARILKVILDPELQDPWRKAARELENPAEVLVAQIGDRRLGDRVVRHVERLGAELNPLPAEADAARHHHVDNPAVRATIAASGRVAKRAERWLRERGPVQPHEVVLVA